MKRQHMGLKKVAVFVLSKEQILANKHKRLITLMDAYQNSDDPITRMEIRLDALDMIRQIETLEAQVQP